ncbi:TRAP transporter small permease subunit [Roseovarius sp.]|uniref:TRAP transporter small permease subunit n=1 Tax=Roseovarius sp. TaxID=1486281 RepID=UPI003567910B
MGDLLARTDRALARVETPLNLIGGVFVLGLAALGVAQVVMRSVFGMPILGYVDVIEQGTAVFAFLGLAFTQRAGGHIRMEILIQALPRPALWRVEVFNTLFAGMVVTLLLPGAWQYFYRAWSIGDSTMSVGLPTWPSKLLVFVSLGLLLVRLIVQLWGFSRLAVRPEADPVAVPLPANAAEVAAGEVNLIRQERHK